MNQEDVDREFRDIVAYMVPFGHAAARLSELEEALRRSIRVDSSDQDEDEGHRDEDDGEGDLEKSPGDSKHNPTVIYAC